MLCGVQLNAFDRSIDTAPVKRLLSNAENNHNFFDKSIYLQLASKVAAFMVTP